MFPRIRVGPIDARAHADDLHRACQLVVPVDEGEADRVRLGRFDDAR